MNSVKVAPIPLSSNQLPLNDLSSFTSSPKNNRKSSKFSHQREKKSRLFTIASKIQRALLCCLIFCLKFPWCCLQKQSSPQENANANKEYSLPILKFFKLLIMVIRIKELFRSRTIYKTISKLKDFQAFLIDDLAYYTRKGSNQENKLNYLSCASFRRIIRAIRKKFKKFWKSFRKLKGKF